jgi:hypothetical protein
MGAVAAVHSGFYTDKRAIRQGLLGVCHGNEHLSWGCSGGCSPFFAEINADFGGNSERADRSSQRPEDIFENHARKGGLGHTF